MWTECLLRCCMLLPVVPVGGEDVAGLTGEDQQISQPASLEQIDFAKAFAEARPWDLEASKNAVHTICEIRKEVGLATLCEFSCAADVSGELNCTTLASDVCEASAGGSCCAKSCCTAADGANTCCAAKSGVSACTKSECTAAACTKSECNAAACTKSECNTATCTKSACTDAACAKSECAESSCCQGKESCGAAVNLMANSDQEFETLMLSEFGVPAEEVRSFHIELVNEPIATNQVKTQSPEMVRKAGRELDQVANDLEDQGMYDTADQLRRISQQLRERVRR